MKDLKLNFIEKFDNSKIDLIKCMIFTFIIGLVSHGYMFFNNSISHDSLCEFIALESVFNHKYGLGRVFVPIYEAFIRGIITAPWLIGMLMLIYIALSVFLVVKMFEVRSDIMKFLISLIFTSNISVIALIGTYIHDGDCDMLALLMAVFSVYLWCRYKKGFLIGAIPLMISLGLYQSKISIAITLIMIYSIMEIIKGEELKTVFVKLMKGATMVVLGGILYFVVFKLILIIIDVPMETGRYNSLDKFFENSFWGLVKSCFGAYFVSLKNIIIPKSIFGTHISGILNLSIIFAVASIIIKYILKIGIKRLENVFLIALIILMPFFMNVSHVLSSMSHDLMHYSIYFSYLIILLIVDWYCKDEKIKTGNSIKNKIKTITYLLITIIFLGNIRMANTVYLVKNFAYDSTLSLMTRVSDKMYEKDGYEAGVTSVAFIGSPDNLVSIPYYDDIFKITGTSNYDDVLGSADSEYYKSYFNNILFTPIKVISNKEVKNLSKRSEVQEMEVFPHNDSIKYIDNVLVVKMGEIK